MNKAKRKQLYIRMTKDEQIELLMQIVRELTVLLHKLNQPQIIHLEKNDDNQ